MFKAVYAAHQNRPDWRICTCDTCAEQAQLVLQTATDRGLRGYARAVLNTAVYGRGE